MTDYSELSKKPRKFLSLTGYTLEEFTALVPHFLARFREQVQTFTLDGKKRKKRSYSSYRNSPLPTIEEKLLFIWIDFRKAMTQDVLGELLGIEQPVANKWIHTLTPILSKALADLGELPQRESSTLIVNESGSSLYFHDGTERPINRPVDPSDQKTYYSGQKNSIL